MFHIFRNTPLGRENLLQSVFFCQQVKNLALTIFHPTSKQCTMFFDSTVVTLDLDSSYTRYAETASEHMSEVSLKASSEAVSAATEIGGSFLTPQVLRRICTKSPPTAW